MKRWLVRGLLVLVSLLAAAVCAEAVLRRVDPFGISYYRDNARYFQEAVEQVTEGGLDPSGRLFQNRPGVDLELVRFDFRTDAAGYRSGVAGAPFEPRAPEAPRETYRVLCLGDSVTLAWGVDDEHSWARQLERGRRAADGRPLEVLNAGHLMYDTVQEADLLRAWGPAARPDLVLVMFISNDLRSSHQNLLDQLAAGRAQREAPSPWAQLRYQVARPFPALRGLAQYLDQRAFLEDVEDLRTAPPDELPGYPDGWRRCADALADLRATSEELGADFVVLDNTIPRLAEVEAWCAENGVPRVDTVFTDAEWAADIRNSAVDSHYNALGNRYLEEKVAGGLAELGLLAP